MLEIKFFSIFVESVSVVDIMGLDFVDEWRSYSGSVGGVFVVVRSEGLQIEILIYRIYVMLVCCIVSFIYYVLFKDGVY